MLLLAGAPLQWRHNGCDGVSNNQPHHCLLNRLFRSRSKKTSKLRVTGLCAGSSPVTTTPVIKWKHFPRYWPFVRGIPRSPVNSPHKSQCCGALMFSLICVWINGWVNNDEAGYLRRHRTRYDVIVMCVHIYLCMSGATGGCVISISWYRSPLLTWASPVNSSVTYRKEHFPMWNSKIA